MTINFNTNPDWIKKMVDIEEDQIVSAGGWFDSVNISEDQDFNNYKENVRTHWISETISSDRKFILSASERFQNPEIIGLMQTNPVAALCQSLDISNPAQMNRYNSSKFQKRKFETISLEKEKWIISEADSILRHIGAIDKNTKEKFHLIREAFPIVSYESSITDPKFEGCLITDGKRNGIFINTLIPYSSRRDFTFAHEIGHFILHSKNAEAPFIDGVDTLDNFQEGIELEANLFASGLLIPSSVLKTFYNPIHPPRMTHVNSLMDKCGTSALATMCRLVRATPYPAVLIVIKNGIIDWYLKSDSFVGIPVTKGSAIPKNSAADLFNSRQNGQEKSHESNISAHDWLLSGSYQTADVSTFKISNSYTYIMLSFHD